MDSRPHRTNLISLGLDGVTYMDSLNPYMELIQLGNEAREIKQGLTHQTTTT